MGCGIWSLHPWNTRGTYTDARVATGAVVGVVGAHSCKVGRCFTHNKHYGSTQEKVNLTNY